MTSPVVVDANVFLRYIVRAETARDVEHATTAASLFAQCEQGLLEIMTDTAVIAEVVFILSSRRHYALSREDTVFRLRPLLQLPGCILNSKAQALQALDRWQASSKLSYVDALVIEQALANDAPLATFDGPVRQTASVRIWHDQ